MGDPSLKIRSLILSVTLGTSYPPCGVLVSIHSRVIAAYLGHLIEPREQSSK